MSKFLEQRGSQVLLHVKAVPNSSRTQVAGVLGNAIKIKVAQPPEDGRANKAIVELLAEALGLPKQQVTLVSSPSHPLKTFQLGGMTLADAEQKLADLL